MAEIEGLRRRLALAGMLAPGVLVVAEMLDLAPSTRLAVGAFTVGLWCLAAPRQRPQRRFSWMCLVLGAVLVPLGLVVRSPLFGAVGVAALVGAVDRRRASSAVQLIVSTLATMGISIAYLHTVSLWDGEVYKVLVGLLGGLLGIGGGGEGAYLFFADQRVHISLLSPLPALWMSLAVALAAGSSWRRTLRLLAISGVVLTGLRAGLLFVLLPAGLVAAAPRLILLLTTVAAGVGAALTMPREEGWAEPVLAPASAVAGAALAAAVVLVTAYPGPPIEAITIDEAHGRWETTEASYTQTGYGRHTVYNYSLLRLWLEERFAVRTLAEPPILPAGDLLVIKTPTRPYRPEERRAVRDFVWGGGSLLVFADHTDLFGSSSIVNELLEDYGLKVEPTATIPLSGVTRRLPGRWWNGPGLVAPGTHLDLQTTATLRGRGVRGLMTESLLVDLGVAAERADYSNERRFGELTVTGDDAFGWAPTVAVSRYGLGSVVVVSDSTPWSNFSLLAPGNRELVRGLLRVFERPPVPLPAALVGALVVLVVAIIGTRQLTVEALVWLFAAWTLGWGVLALVAATEGDQSVRFQSGHSLVVLGPWSDVSWDTDIRLGTHADKSVYSLFFSTMPRVGVYPEMVEDFEVRPESRLVAVINVAKPIPSRWLFELERWVRKGGTLMVMDDPLWRGSEDVLPVLTHFGFGFGLELGHGGLWTAAGPTLPDNVFLLPLLLLQDHRVQKGEELLTYGDADYGLSNCEPLWADDAGLVVLGVRRVGEGRVVAFLRSRVFSQLVMGDVWGGVEPGRYRQELYELEYRLLKLLVEDLEDAPTASSEVPAD